MAMIGAQQAHVSATSSCLRADAEAFIPASHNDAYAIAQMLYGCVLPLLQSIQYQVNTLCYRTMSGPVQCCERPTFPPGRLEACMSTRFDRSDSAIVAEADAGVIEASIDHESLETCVPAYLPSIAADGVRSEDDFGAIIDDFLLSSPSDRKRDSVNVDAELRIHHLTIQNYLLYATATGRMLCSGKSSLYENRKVQDSTWGAVRLSSQDIPLAGVDLSLPFSSSIVPAAVSLPEPFLERRMGAVSITSNMVLALPPDLATTHHSVSTMQIPLDVVTDFAKSYPNINATRRYRFKHRCVLSCCYVRSDDVLSKPCVWCQAPDTHFQCTVCAAARVCQVCHSVREAGRKFELSRKGHEGHDDRSFSLMTDPHVDEDFDYFDDSEQEEYDFTDEWTLRDFDYALKHFPSSIPATVRARFDAFA